MILGALFLCSLTGGPHPAKAASMADVVISPTVQLGDRVANGEDSVAILWQTTDTDHPYSVGLKQGGKTWKAAPFTFRTINVNGIEPHRVYSATVKGYKAGQTIDYTLEGDGNVLFKGSFMAPKSEKQPYTFAVFGDCGCASPEEAEISYQTSLTKPDLLLLTGDLVYSRGLATEYRKNFYPFYTAEVASPKNGSPVLCNTLTAAAPGNHDILNRDLDAHGDALAYFYYWSQPLNGPLTDNGNKSTPTLRGADDRQKAFLVSAGPNYPRMANFSFDYGNAHITSLDANSYVNWQDPALRQWLKDDIAKGAKKTWRFVMFHQPGFHSSANHQEEKQMRQVADIFEEGKVDVVFAGHVHNYQRSFPIQVGPKAGASAEELRKDDWPVDKSYDGMKNTHPKGVVYIVDGAGGNSLYNTELNGKPELWKPYQAQYLSDWNFSIVKVDGKHFLLRQIDREGKEVDRISIDK